MKVPLTMHFDTPGACGSFSAPGKNSDLISYYSFLQQILTENSVPGPLLELGMGGQGDSHRPVLREMASNHMVSCGLCHLSDPRSEEYRSQAFGSRSRAWCG